MPLPYFTEPPAILCPSTGDAFAPCDARDLDAFRDADVATLDPSFDEEDERPMLGVAQMRGLDCGRVL